VVRAAKLAFNGLGTLDRGIYSAFCGGVQLFEILQDGFHTPLSESQIAELFKAGRLNRHTRCKPEKQGRWRTIDELFPLLKYNAPWGLVSEPAESASDSRFRGLAVIAVSVVGTAAVALILYLCIQNGSSAKGQVTAIDSIPAPQSQSAPPRSQFFSTQRIRNTVSPTTTASLPNAASNQIVVSAGQPEQDAPARSTEAARLAEQRHRDQLAQQQRQQQEEAARQQRLLEQQQKAAGRDEHVPLDEWQIVDVGGEAVRVKIHDNDVTSFDVWINGQWRHEVPKVHGITHSRTDEVPIYSNRRATLYYVWEISGHLNHCLLRVRDA
jgi:hypothetical protein